MKHIFVINPKAGKEKNRERLESYILESGKKLGKDVEIYETTAAGDGEDFVRRTSAAKAPDEKIRFYACGGDGALHEIVNGAYGFDNVEVGIIPVGTGNDYIRNFGTKQQFLDIEAQLMGESVVCDMIQFISDDAAPRCCANMFNIGFDCNVAAETSKTKKIPYLNGSLAYILALVIMLVKKEGANLRIKFDDGDVFDDEILLMTIANGSFCGGGWFSNPHASLNDGKMDIGIIKDIPRRKFPGLLPKYKNGTHYDKKGIEKILVYKKCESMTVYGNNGKLQLCADGEISLADKIQFKILPASIRIAVPAGAGK